MEGNTLMLVLLSEGTFRLQASQHQDIKLQTGAAEQRYLFALLTNLSTGSCPIKYGTTNPYKEMGEPK